MGQQEAPGKTEEAQTATGAVDSPWPVRRSIGPPYLHLRRHHGWQIEVAFFDSKQFLGLHEPRVWSAPSVERAHPMAWFVLSMTVLWYAVAGKDGPQVQRARPWYSGKVTPTFTEMLGALRLQLWQGRITSMSEESGDLSEVLEMLLHWVAAVR